MEDRVNALVAEWIMGWIGVAKRRVVVAIGEEMVLKGLPRKDAPALMEVPNYSTSTTYALEIDRRMSELGEATQDRYICALIELTLGQDAVRRHKDRGLYSDQILALMNASPLDKCLAALKASGVEV